MYNPLGEPKKPKPWPWYQPKPEIPKKKEGKDWLALFNKLLPLFGKEDIPFVARWLYAQAGGKEGPFQKYLRERYKEQPEISETARWRKAQKTLGGMEGLDPGVRRYIETLFTTAKSLSPRGTRTRASELRYQTQLPQMLRRPPAEARNYVDLLYRLLIPTELTPPPGRLMLIQGRPYLVPNQAWT